MTNPTRETWSSDRREAMQTQETAKVTVLVPGVELRPLVGDHNGARNLFTGLLTLTPKASYTLYTRPVTEVSVLVTGEAAVEVEDRRYLLRPLDAMTVPTGLPRRLVNPSTIRPALLHVSLAAATPVQTWVNGRFTPVEQLASSTGRPGAERLCRNNPATRFELAPRAQFQDLFSAELGAHGICGGYGIFEPGARLPCHRHEFDESITIVQGSGDMYRRRAST